MSPTFCNIFLDFVIKDVRSIDRFLNMSKDVTLVIHYADDIIDKHSL